MMKWFKHMADLSRDEGVCRFLYAAGDRQAAYGFLLRILEAIAEKMTPTCGIEDCVLDYPLRDWRRILDCNHNRLMKYLPLLEGIPWVEVELVEDSCRVFVPKMLNWRDEYSRKSGHSPNNVAQSRVEENRTEKNESRDSPSKCLAGKEHQTPPQDFAVSPEMREWAKSMRPEIDIDLETEKFRLYEFRRPISSWEGAWRKWILGAKVFGLSTSNGRAMCDRVQDLKNLAPLLGITRGVEESESDYLARIDAANQKRLQNMNA